MRLDELTGRRVVLLGLGADVLAAVPAVRSARPAGVRVVEEGTGTDPTGWARVSLDEAAAWGDVFLRSPGFPRYQTVLVAALERGARMTTPLDLWLGTHGADRQVVAITGTKGKSTVTALVGSLAAAAGLRVGVAGNLGVPVFDGSGWDADAPIIVLEVSSYQAADLHHPPDIAVLTFLSEDHLSWHGGVDAYVADKLRVLENDGGVAGQIFVPVDGGRAASVVAAMGLDAEVVAPPVLGPAGGGNGGLAAARSSTGPVEPAASVEPSVPRHRLQNAALAARVLASIGGPVLSDAAVVDAARSSLPGRLDPCPPPPARPGLLCIDDALGSNPSATAAGLAWLRTLGRPTVVILGGADRGVDAAPLTAEVAEWPVERLCGVAVAENGAALAAVSGLRMLPLASASGSAGSPDDHADAELAGAVAAAVAWLPDDGVLIFSPGAPTPVGAGNWASRSAAFRRALVEPPG